MKSLIKYFSTKSIIKDVYGYGYDFSIKRYVISIIAVIITVLAVGRIYGLKWWGILIVSAFILCVFPMLIRKRYENNHRMKRFSEVDIYLHQMSYSFMRNPKIYAALSDTYDIAQGHLKNVVKEALDELEYGMSDNIYENALSIIEEEYNCSRIRTLHKFLSGIEKKGGRYKNALRVLSEDFDKWVESIYQYEYEIKNIKRDTTVGIIISIVLAGLTIIMGFMLNTYNNSGKTIIDDGLYQVSSTIFLVLCVIFYAYTSTHYGKDILDDSNRDKQSEYYYKLVFNTSIRSIIEKIIPLILVLVVALIFTFIQKIYFVAAYIALTIIVLLINPFIRKKTAQKKLVNYLRSSFSDWLREVALNLENKPLIAAIEDTYEECPYIIKNSLDDFIRNIECDATDIKPYYEFLSEYGQMDIMATVRTLYSISELDEKGVDETINSLIQRNNEIINKQAKTEYKDKISILKFMEYIPVFFMALKLAIDMMIIITIYL